MDREALAYHRHMRRVAKEAKSMIEPGSAVTELMRERDDARELAAMYLQCLNSRALERGETVEAVAAFCEREFAESPWLKAEYERLSKIEAELKRDVEAIKRFGRRGR